MQPIAQHALCWHGDDETGIGGGGLSFGGVGGGGEEDDDDADEAEAEAGASRRGPTVIGPRSFYGATPDLCSPFGLAAGPKLRTA